jgi:hypothetical protein
MLSHPAMRSMLIARLRQVAITRGACPVRTWIGHRLQGGQQSLVARRVRAGRQRRGRWHAGVTSGSGGWLRNLHPNPLVTPATAATPVTP